MRLSIPSVLIAVIAAATPTLAQPLGCHELTPGARVDLTCFAPCECPAPPDTTLVGTFDLQAIYIGGATSMFRLGSIDLHVVDNGTTGISTIRGQGVQRQFIAGGQEIELETRLLLSIDGAPPRIFESAASARGDLFGDFHAIVADNGFVCNNTVITLNAQPADTVCPEPACDCDLNTDGAAAIDDLLLYLDLWFDRDSLAERSFSLAIEVDDLLNFLDCWLDARATGCE